jgi:MarR-like DNA-binding transcriptional regulator SgrR of sgrS sRNA
MNDRYFAMRAHFYEREEHNECHFKLKELETLWFCSLKNVKRILHLYETEGKLTYTPGKGRGNASTLLFSESFHAEVEQFIKNCLENDRLDQAAQLLRLPIPKTWIAKISTDIREMFGFHRNTETKDILHAFISRDITTLDPLKVSISFESHLIEQLGDTLVKYDAKEDQISPHIAHHYEVDETKMVWTFYLRKGILFHHQESLTSRDVAATINRIQHGPVSYAWLASDIAYVECIGTYNVKIHMRRPNPFFLRYLASPNFSILPAGIPFSEEEWIGSGPFQLKEKNENKLVLEAFDGYFKERPLLDEIHFYKVSQEAADLVNFTVEYEESVEPLSKYEIETGFRFLMFNFQQNSLVQHSSFRKAIFHLLDMNKMAEDLGWEQWYEASSFSKQRSIKLSKDATIISQLLKEAGYIGEELNLFHLDFQRAYEEAKWFQVEAKKFGIQFVLHSFNFIDFYKREIDEQIDLIFMGEVLSLDPHLSFLGAFYNETLLFSRMLPQNDLQWIYDKLEIFKQVNADKREKVLEDIEEYIRENNLLIFQHHPVKTRTFHPMIQDVEFHSFGHFDFKKLWIPG